MTTPADLLTYRPQDHYWLVEARPGEVYNSTRFGFFALTDATYLAWSGAGHVATPIGTEALLREVLNTAGVAYLAEPLPAIEEDRPRIVRARARLVATTFSITSGVPKAIPWTNDLVDPLGMHDPAVNPERITCLQPGWYKIVIGIRFVEAVGGRVGTRALQIALGLGGSPTDLGTMRLAPSLAGNTEFGFTEFAQLAVGDILRGFCEQASGAPMSALARITLVREE